MKEVELRRAYRTQESLVRYLAEQAVDLCADIEDESLNEYIEPVQAARRALDFNRRLIVIGTAQSGKSTVLAGVANLPVIARTPMEGHYLCWRYSHRDTIDDTHARYIPLPWLDGLELVDTAACDGPARAACETLLQGADVVIAVIDARAAESSPVWQMLAALPEQVRSCCALAVTHSDELPTEAAVTLKSALQQLAATLRPQPPIFYIQPDKDTGTGALRERVSETLRSAPPLRTAIRWLAERAEALSEKQSRVLRKRYSASLTDRSFISTIDQGIDYFLTRQMGEIDKLQTGLDKAVESVMPRVLHRIRAMMGHTLSPTVLLRLELMGMSTDHELYEQIVAQVKLSQAELDRLFTLNCAGHWRMVKPDMKKTLDFEIGEFPEADLEAELAELRERLCQDLYEPFANIKMRHKFNHLFVAQAGWMHMCMVFLCFLLVAAGTLGFLGQDTAGLCCVAAAALVWLAGSLGNMHAYRRISAEVRELTLQLRSGMKEAMRPVLERLIVSRVTAYRQLYIKPRQKVALRDDMLKPLQEKQKNIFHALRALLPSL